MRREALSSKVISPQSQELMRVVGLAGPIKSGKSSVARILCEKAGFSRLSFGQLVVEQVNAQHLNPTRGQLQETGTQLIRELGYEGITDLLLRKMDKNPFQVIEGVRHAGVDSYLRKRFKNVYKLVYVDCPLEERFRRAQTENPQLTTETFLTQDEAPIEWGTRALRVIAEVVFSNDRGVDELTYQVSRFL
jgi:dephospho-CoA kinase